MNKQDYFLLRRSKRITLTTLAKYIGCSQSLLSRYELDQCEMSDYKVKKYNEYITNFNQK